MDGPRATAETRIANGVTGVGCSLAFAGVLGDIALHPRAHAGTGNGIRAYGLIGAFQVAGEHHAYNANPDSHR